MVPYLNASLLVQLLIPLLPSLERLQNEEGTIGRQQITKYTRYLTLTWSILLSSYTAFGVIKPFVFNWNTIIALKIILSLTIGSMLSMRFAELITRENLGNGPSMIVFINIIGGLRRNLIYFISNISNFSAFDRFAAVIVACFIYLVAIFTVIVVQGSYKRIKIISTRGELSESSPLMISSIKKRLRRSKNNFLFTYIPLQLNQGGIMPLVFSSTVAIPLVYPVQIFLNSQMGADIGLRTNLLTFYSFGLNIILVIFFSCFYVSLVLKPTDMSENLSKMAYSIPGIRQGRETTKFFTVYDVAPKSSEPPKISTKGKSNI